MWLSDIETKQNIEDQPLKEPMMMMMIMMLVVAMSAMSRLRAANVLQTRYNSNFPYPTGP